MWHWIPKSKISLNILNSRPLNWNRSAWKKKPLQPTSFFPREDTNNNICIIATELTGFCLCCLCCFSWLEWHSLLSCCVYLYLDKEAAKVTYGMNLLIVLDQQSRVCVTMEKQTDRQTNRLNVTYKEIWRKNEIVKGLGSVFCYSK